MLRSMRLLLFRETLNNAKNNSSHYYLEDPVRYISGYQLELYNLMRQSPRVRFKDCLDIELVSTFISNIIYYDSDISETELSVSSCRSSCSFGLLIDSVYADIDDLLRTHSMYTILYFLQFFKTKRLKMPFSSEILRQAEAEAGLHPNIRMNFHWILNLDSINGSLANYRFQNSNIGEKLRISVYGGKSANSLFLKDIYTQAREIKTSRWWLSDEISLKYFNELGKLIIYQTDVEGFKKIWKELSGCIQKRLVVELTDSWPNVQKIKAELKELASVRLILQNTDSNIITPNDLAVFNIHRLKLAGFHSSKSEIWNTLRQLRQLSFENSVIIDPLNMFHLKGLRIKLENCFMEMSSIRLL
jgi:hypothetical protein